MRFDSIHNYYESLVVRELVQCFEVDMAFFLTSKERSEMDKSVHEAVTKAKVHVDGQNNSEDRPNTFQHV